MYTENVEFSIEHVGRIYSGDMQEFSARIRVDLNDGIGWCMGIRTYKCILVRNITSIAPFLSLVATFPANLVSSLSILS